jgi:hypothetical protein
MDSKRFLSVDPSRLMQFERAVQTVTSVILRGIGLEP